MMYSPSLFGVVLAAIASMAAGFAWYSPLLFGNQWMKLKGYDKKSLEKAQKEMGPLYGVSFVATIVSAYILGWLGNALESSTSMQWLQLGFMVWLGFVAVTQLTGFIFSQKRSIELFAIDTGYQLTSILLIALILGIFEFRSM